MSQANAAAIKRRVNAPQLQQQNARPGQVQQSFGQVQQSFGQVQQSFGQGTAQAQQSFGQGTAQAQQSQGAGQAQAGLTLQQVISVIDKRLVNVELGLKEIKDNNRQGQQPFVQGATQAQQSLGQAQQSLGQAQQSLGEAQIDDNAFSSMVEEFNNRFELVAMEINNLKDVVLKLQSYTMEVNKTLLEERINILSDLGNATESVNVDHESIAEPEQVDAEDGVESVNLQLVE